MRSTDLKEILFPVGVRTIQFQTGSQGFREIPTHKVVLNLHTEQPVGVVGENYRLVTNMQALEYARQCARQLFGTMRADDLEVFNVLAPPRGWCCHVDLIHKGFEVNVGRSEIYLPFVRVTNSYNATRALRFDVGFCRSLCLNGVIFESEAIQFRFSHSRKGIPATLNFEIAKGKLDNLRLRFESDADKLFDFRIPPGSEVPLFFKALNLPVPPTDELTANQKEFCTELNGEIRRRIGTYFDRLGRNAYALFNAMTDFASHPPQIKYFHRSPHAMQTAAGRWSREFVRELISKPTFDLNVYLASHGSMPNQQN